MHTIKQKLIQSHHPNKINSSLSLPSETETKSRREYKEKRIFFFNYNVNLISTSICDFSIPIKHNSFHDTME